MIVPLAGAGTDEEALTVIGEAYPGREVVGVPGAALAYGGGGPHCITQQVPARSPEHEAHHRDGAHARILRPRVRSIAAIAARRRRSAPLAR